MYAYFIDDWVYNNHHRKLDRLDLVLTQKGIQGRKIKLSRLHDLGGSIKDCLSSGIKTFVAVGSDTTTSRVLNSMLKDNNFSFSFACVPIDEPRAIARVFGYGSMLEAVDALAVHRTSKIDIGLLNKRHYFVTAAVFPKKCSLGFKSYSISSLYRDHHISVCNSNIYMNHTTDYARNFDITDGVFEAVIARRPQVSFFDKMRGKGNDSVYIPETMFPVKSIIIKSKDKTLSVFADAEKQLTSPIKVDILPQMLEVIIGKDFYGSKQH